MEENIEKNKVWPRGNGILSIRLGKLSNKDNTFQLLDETEKSLEEFPDSQKVIIDLGSFPFASSVHTSSFRKDVVEKLVNLRKKVGSKKVAIFGGNVIKRTITSFVVSASGIENIKVFEAEKEALKWLEEK